MKIGLDVSPLENTSMLTHRVRGTGFYIENLKKSLLKYFSQNEYVFFTRGELLEENVNIVHYPYFEPFFLSLPLRKRHKTVVTVHDLTPLVFPKYFPVGIRGNLKWQLQKIALRGSNAIITDSECSKKDIMRFTGIHSEKINVVYLAAGEEFKRIENGKLRIENLRKKYYLSEKFVLYVGDVTWNKNLPRFLEAINKTKIPLVMVGKALIEKNFDRNNPWNQDLIKVQKLIKNNKRIILLGFVPQEDLVMLYNAATVFAMPSLYEGFGLPILEAMSCGCPVVTTKNGSLSEVAGEAAYYVNPYNIDSIIYGIKEIFTKEDLQKSFSQKGILQAKQFSWKKTAEQTIRIYEKTN